MNEIRPVIAALMLAIATHAQPSTPKVNPMRELLDQAGSSRVEFAADLGLAILDKGKLPVPISQSYLERLANRAGEAQRAFPSVPAAVRGEWDFRSGFLQVLSLFNLDGLSIRLRAIKRIAVVDPRLARQIASSLRGVSPPSDIDCEALSVPTLGFVFYESLLPLLPDEYPFLVGHLPTLQHVVSLVGALTQEHDLTILLGQPSVANYSEEQRRVATLSLITAFGSIRASDRVFSTAELLPGLLLGERVQGLLKSGKIPPGLEIPLAKAYIGFVERQLRADRCADTLADNGDDRLVKAAVARSLELSSAYGIDALNTKDIPRKFSSQTPPVARDSREAEAGKRELLVLSGKLKQVGSSELRDRLISASESYAHRPLAESDAAFDAADRCLTLLGLALSQEEAIAPRLFALAAALLEQTALKDNEPIAWIILVRIALNETNDPKRELAAEASRFFRSTRDRDLALYFRAQQLVGLVPRYQDRPLNNFQSILGKF